jgi:L-asparaginase II
MPSPEPTPYPENPILVRVTRGGVVESVHRGAYCVADVNGRVRASAGAIDHPVYTRSSIKSLQALALLEGGGAERCALQDVELALMIASHSGEAEHTAVVEEFLRRLGFSVADLRCGTHPPFDARVRAELQQRGAAPSALHNNCSGKHAGFLALAQHLDEPPARYLDPRGRTQTLVRATLAEVTGAPAATLVPGIDGCSAPTYRLPLRVLATAFARLTNPDGLSSARQTSARRLTRVAAEHPVLISGSHQCLDTEILRVSRGRLFPKIGAEAVHAIGFVGAGLGLALKIDDGGARALNPLVLGLLEELGLARPEELAGLSTFRERQLRNAAGLAVGTLEPVVAGPLLP